MGDIYQKLLCVEVRLAVVCDSCNHTIPVNGALSKVKCDQCQEITELSGRFNWSDLLNYHNPGYDIFSGTLYENKQGEGNYGCWNPVKLNTKRTWPVCPSCKNEFDKEQVILQANSGSSLICEKCNAALSVQKAPSNLKKAFSFIKYIVGGNIEEIGEQGQTIDSPLKKQPVVMACMSCGGTLRIDGSKRLVECTFCQSSNYLPDDLWLSIHPAPKREFWYIIFDTRNIKRGW